MLPWRYLATKALLALHDDRGVHPADARHPDRLGRGRTEVEDPVAGVGPAIVDPDHDALAVVLDEQPRVEGQFLGRRRELARVEDLSVRGRVAFEARSVPRGLALERHVSGHEPRRDVERRAPGPEHLTQVSGRRR